MPAFRPEYFENGVYHVYNRGVAKLPTFIGPDDYHDFQDILRYFLIGFPVPTQKYANLPDPGSQDLPVTYKADPQSNGLFKPLVDIIGYCLMPNHFHLLVQLKNPDGEIKKPNGRFAYFHTLPELIRRVGITYSHKFNRRHKREGALFQGRFKVKHIPSDPDLLQVIRYIHLNPVVASLVQKPAQWAYSDYQNYATPGSMRTFQVTNTKLVLSYFSGKSEKYVEFVHDVITENEARVIGQYVMDVEK